MPEIISTTHALSKKANSWLENHKRTLESTYQERWRQTISQNALCENAHSTKVHPGAKNLQAGNLFSIKENYETYCKGQDNINENKYNNNVYQ